MGKTYSPLRYPGGKTKIYNQMLQIIKENNLSNGTYIEPYAGGAGLALKLLLREDINQIYINDFDISIYSFWKSILYETEKFCHLITNTEITIDEWYKQREIQKNKQNVDTLTLGFSTFFLNRTNRSGIIKGGVIGGYKQSGDYTLDCRFNKKDLIRKIMLISTHREKIHLYNLDAVQFIETIKDNIPVDSLIYLDPPYYGKGPELYTNFYTHDNHLELSCYMSQINHLNWLITYDDCEEIKKMYDSFEQFEYNLNYSAQTKRKGTEIMIYNNIQIKEAAN